MDGDGCRVQFSDAEAAKFLRPETLNLLAKIRQEKEIDEAELLGLEKCRKSSSYVRKPTKTRADSENLASQPFAPLPASSRTTRKGYSIVRRR